jgi:predicted esterase
MIDRALEWTFCRYSVDPACMAVGGFSDGASYALSLGLTNGDLFTHVFAFSPGFMAPAARGGSPRIFITHGTHDQVLPIDVCSRRIVPQLERSSYQVRYREFEGGHRIPPEMVREALEWFAAEQGRRA